MIAIASIVFAVVLSAPFGEAEAAAIDDRDGLAIEVSVEVRTPAEVVLVRPFSTFEELPPTALRNVGSDVWGGVVVIPTAEDWFIAFEVIDPDGATTRSDTTTLVELGVDPVVVAGEPAEPVGSSIDSSTWWLAAALVLGIAALGALSWWTFGPDRSAESEGSAEGDDPDELES